jgi:hypothetical protein
MSQILTVAIDGAGPFRGAEAVAGEVRAVTADVEAAIDRFVAIHLRLAAANGALTGLGGVATLPITVPAGVGGYFIVAGRLVAGVAHLRGHDLASEDVRTAVLLTMAGGGPATEILREVGVEIGRRGAAAAVRRVPGRTLVEINKRVGFRLLTKAGTTGVVNLGRLVPFVGAPIGATTDLLSMRAVAAYARSSFPPAATASDRDATPVDGDATPADGDATPVDGDATPVDGGAMFVAIGGPSGRGRAVGRRLATLRDRTATAGRAGDEAPPAVEAR